MQYDLTSVDRNSYSMYFLGWWARYNRILFRFFSWCWARWRYRNSVILFLCGLFMCVIGWLGFLGIVWLSLSLSRTRLSSTCGPKIGMLLTSHIPIPIPIVVIFIFMIVFGYYDFLCLGLIIFMHHSFYYYLSCPMGLYFIIYYS